MNVEEPIQVEKTPPVRQEDPKADQRERNQFLIRNLLRGMLWLVVLVAAIVITKRLVDFKALMQPLNEHPFMVFTVYTISEILVGIIPPELFMLWGTEYGTLTDYIWIVATLAALSYGAGVLGYWFGRYLNGTRLYDLLYQRFFQKVDKYLDQFGIFMVIVASLTPLPFSGTAMLTGALKLPFKKYILFSLIRFLRFAVYAIVIYESAVMA